MKNSFKKVIALFSAASLLFLGACSGSEDIRNHTEKVDVDKFTAEFIFNDNGLIEKEKKFYDNQKTTYEYYECYEYNENNQITKRYATDLDGNILEKHDLFEMSYNENGTIDMISENGINYVFEYDANGKPVKYQKIQNSVLLKTVRFGYDENGNKTSEKSYVPVEINGADELMSETVYAYNENGLVISAKTTSANKIVTNDVAYEYSEDGLVTKYTRKSNNEIRTTVYEYKNGVLLKETMDVAPAENSDRDTSRSYVTTYEYFANGNVIKFSRARDGEVYITDAYSIDEAKGNFFDFDNIIAL